MSNFTTAEALRTLLGLYEGVRIGRVRIHPSGAASVVLQVTHPTSLVRLARCAENANVAFYVWSNSQGVTEEGAEYDEGPWYELRAEANPPGSELPTTAQMFCADMVHDPVRRGILDQVQGNRLLAGWGGANDRRVPCFRGLPRVVGRSEA
jgi:hypothetical protein